MDNYSCPIPVHAIITISVPIWPMHSTSMLSDRRNKHMAFRGLTLEAIIQDINGRRQQKVPFAKVKFSDDEYRVLRQEAIRIFKRNGNPNKSEQIVFLAFACAYVQKNIYLQDYSFWKDFHVELETTPAKHSTFVLEKLLLPAYGCKEVDIEIIKKGKNRQIVESLVKAVCAESLATCAQFVKFFCWFYQWTSDQEVSERTLQKYQDY